MNTIKDIPKKLTDSNDGSNNTIWAKWLNCLNSQPIFTPPPPSPFLTITINEETDIQADDETSK